MRPKSARVHILASNRLSPQYLARLNLGDYSRFKVTSHPALPN